MMKVVGGPDLQTGWSSATLTIRFLRPYVDPATGNAAAGTYYGRWTGSALQARGGGDFLIPGPVAAGDPQPLLEVTSTVIYPGLGPVQSRREGFGHPNAVTAGEFDWRILSLDGPAWNGTGGNGGQTGTPGATGPTGPKGDKGDKGDTGNTGATGANGADANLPPLPSPLTTPRVLTASPNGVNNTALSWEEKGGGSSLTVREVDGAPSAVVAILEFPNASVTMSGTGENAKASIALGTDPALTARVAALETQNADKPPAIGLSSSASQVTAPATITLTAVATDDVSITKVEFYKGSSIIGTVLSGPYTQAVNLTTADGGVVGFHARAYDSSGQIRYSNTVAVIVGGVGVQYRPLSPTVNLAVSSSAVSFASIPSSAVRAVIQVQLAGVRVASDGSTPTPSSGGVADQGATITLESATELSDFKAIRSSATDANLYTTFYEVQP